jgi:putative MATE family efflux protein
MFVFNQSQILSVLTGLVFLAGVMGAREWFAASLATDEETRQLTVDYLFWFVPAMALQFGIVALGAALRGTGNFKPGMVVQTATVVINIVLAPFLMFGWVLGIKLGAPGAALATLIAIAVGTVWLASYFVAKDSYLAFVPRDWIPRVSMWRDLLKIGLPAGAEFGLTAVYLFVVYTVMRPFGPTAQAGFGIGLRIIQALVLPVVALGFAAAAVAGQNYGARRLDRVRSTMAIACTMAAGVMAVFAVATHAVPGAMIRVFSSDPGAIAVGEEYLRIVSWSFIASGLIFVTSSMFQAIGNTIPPLLTSFSRIALVAIPLLVLATRPGFQLRWIWYLSAGAVVLQMTANLLLLRRELGIRTRALEPATAH